MKKFIPLDAECDERKIQETIAASKAAFLAGEAERTVSHLEFLYLQSRYIQKRWWLLQGLLLTLACALLCGGELNAEELAAAILRAFSQAGLFDGTARSKAPLRLREKSFAYPP